MKIEIQDKKIKQIKADCELIFIVNKKIKHKWVNQNDFKLYNFKGENEKAIVVPEKKKIYIGIAEINGEELRIAAASALKVLAGYKFKTLKVGLYGRDNTQALAEGFLLGDYNFEYYKSKKDKKKINKVIFSIEEYKDEKIELKKTKEEVGTAQIISESVNMVRDLVNIAPSEMNPVRLAEEAKKIAKENSLKINIYGEKYLEKEGMGAFLAVSKASPHPPQLIHLHYKPEKAKLVIALVGKGVTYDTGGLSLKPSQHMSTMKSDESGASAVLGIIQVVSQLNLPIEVHGIVGAVENAIGQNAYKPDDVVKAKNGKTIEIKNTDAEGRLVLADCLVYAQELSPDYIIDLATLTGACVVGLGEYTIGVMGNNQDLKNETKKASESSGELVADLPFNRYLAKLLKSEVADISNVSSSPYGGSITAGLFLNEFIEKKYKDKWLHLDIAGPAFLEKSWGCNPYGGSGAGVRLVIEWLKSLK